ncbi:hypothetical protein AAFF_G00025530 [Aldrovandia affinis]|uniref:Death domain-containing protein n=1 Tax=Aldrovandia affinis TaxID=143900 RepID=A0AAD7S712_9TELE|nr:hypothetical protein AAFF_G00025530 [Aldrovandia affinis]
MKEDLIRMTAILQTDTSSAAKGFQSDPPKESKIEDEEPFSIVEKVKEDLVKVSEILTKDALSENKTKPIKDKTPEEDWEEFSKDEIKEAQQSARSCPPSYDIETIPVRTQSISEKDFSLAKVADYLSSDMGASSLSKMSEMKHRYDEGGKDGEEKQKRVLKPAMALQEHKLKMPPSSMRSSASEKELCKLVDSVFGPDAILESPEDFSHDQDKSPLSDSGFETRSEKTPSAPQSAESTGPKPLFHDVPIPPVITETRTEVVHVIRSYEPPEESPELIIEEAGAMTSPACIEPEPKARSIKDKVKAFQMKVNTEEDSVVSKGLRVKEETHITTTTRMVYHKPTSKDTSERIEETMSVRDIMKAFQSGRDPSKELAGLFEHKAGSPEDDTLEQVSFIDSSGKSPLTPETPSSEEVSYDLTSRTPDSFIGFMPSQPSPIPEVSEESEEEEQGKAFSFKESPPEKPKPSATESTKGNQEVGSRTKEKRVAYIEFPPPPPLDSEQSDPEKKSSCPSSEAETEMMEVNLQEEHDKHLLAEPIIRVQPPSPVPPGADDSDSTEEESVFQPIPFKKYTFTLTEEEEEKASKSRKHENNGNDQESSSNGVGKADDFDLEQNGNDQSITDCSIATTAEFSHDTDATEIDSLDGYDLQDEDDGLWKMFEMTRSGAIDMSKRDFVEERLQFFQIGPQSPCERTDLRMAIVADHLGLSWTELAREMDFSVDEINHIRVDNPNSLTAQSFMLLKKWVNRDGKNATTDALTTVLTKINRMDIVTLLEGPIFDYGNISGTRCFADDNAVFLDQADGFNSIELELQTPTELSYEPPTPLRSDYFFSEEGSDSPIRNPCRPSDLSLSQQPHGPAVDAEPPTVIAEDTSLDSRGDRGVQEVLKEENVAAPEHHDSANAVQEQDMPVEQSQAEDQRPAEDAQPGIAGPAFVVREGRESGSDKEEEEMTHEQLQSLLEDIKLEEGSEGEEMTEEKVQAILCKVEQAEKDMSSIAGWHSETSSFNVEPPTPGRSLSSDLADRQENSPENSSDAITSSSKGQAGKANQNGDHAEAGALPADSVHVTGSQDDATGDSGAGPSNRDEDSLASEHKVQEGRDNESSSEEERTITTRVIRRRVILKGEQAKNIPGESVTEEQYTDEDGNIITRKVIRKVIRRVVTAEDRAQEKGKREGDSKKMEDRSKGLGSPRAKAEVGTQTCRPDCVAVTALPTGKVARRKRRKGDTGRKRFNHNGSALLYPVLEMFYYNFPAGRLLETRTQETIGR